MAITQAQIIEAMVATTLEEKKQWVQRLQRKYDRDRAKYNNNKQQQSTNDASLSASLSPNRIPSFLQSEKDDFNSQDNKNTTSKLYEGSPDEQKSSLGLVGNVSQSNSNNQTQKTTISS